MTHVCGFGLLRGSMFSISCLRVAACRYPQCAFVNACHGALRVRARAEICAFANVSRAMGLCDILFVRAFFHATRAHFLRVAVHGTLRVRARKSNSIFARARVCRRGMRFAII